MESSFSLKPQALSLITRAPVYSLLSPRPVGVIRSEFIGCGHSLRLPRRRCKKLYLKSQSHYYRSIFKASLDSQRILVVAAVAAVSAITVVYFNSPRNQFDIKQMTGRLTLLLSDQIRSMTRWIFTDAHHVDLRKKQSIDGYQDVMKEPRENYQKDKDMGAEIKFKDVGEVLTAEASQFESNMIASSVHHNLTSQTSETPETLTVPLAVSEQDSLSFVEEVCEIHTNTHEYPPEFPVPVMQTNISDAPSASHTQEKTKIDQLKLEVLEVGNINNSNLVLRDSARRALHTLDETSLEKLDNLEPLSYCAALQKNSSYLSLVNNPLVEESDLTASSAVLRIGKFEEERPLGYYNQGVSCQQELGTRKESRKKDKNISSQDRPKKWPPSSNPKEKHNNNKQDPSWQLRVYNQLLREGRLNDCLELLEDLEENGLLDMDKVYHARFFNVCKSQKAVKEAFRFTRLIPNPTLSTFNMLTSVCASSQDSESAFQVLQYVQEAGLKTDCKLYTTLISTCAKSGKVDTMFKVFHEMVNAGVEPNVHTYGALIDGCAKAGQVAKAFGAYGILRSKNVKPDRVIFNALITACGQSGAVDRAFDVLAEMRDETHPMDPDHVTIGALMKACASAGQVDRAREVYKMINEYDIRGSAELYTIAVNSCSHHGDWEFACRVYDDMIRKDVAPDEVFISALIDVAGHAGKVDAAFEILQEARAKGMHVGTISYSSLMGACSKARDWQKALELYEDIKSLNLKPTVPTMNALITALCDADQLQKAMETLSEMKGIGLCPNTITYSILLVASEKKDDLEAGLTMISQAKKDGVTPNLVMCRCLIAMCLRRFQAACTVGEPVLAFTSGQAQLNSKWTSLALMVYRETVIAGVSPTMDELSQVLGCLQLPHDASVRNRLLENLGVSTGTTKGANLYSLIDGFGECDPRAFSIIEEAAARGIIPVVSFKESPIVVDMRNFQVHVAQATWIFQSLLIDMLLTFILQAYLLTVLKGLKYRLAAGAKLPNVNILLPVEKTQIETSVGEKTINIASRVSQAVAALLRRLGLSYQGNESYGKIRVNGFTIRKWLQPKLGSPFSEKTMDLSPSLRHLSSGISRQQRKIRTGHLSLE